MYRKTLEEQKTILKEFKEQETKDYSSEQFEQNFKE